MPISGGKYVAPTWHNGTSPAIDQAELQAMCDTLVCVPIGNGGTGADNATDALTNLGAVPKTSVASKGSANTPVFFNANGVATAISSPLPTNLGGTGASSLSGLMTSAKGVTYTNATTGSATQPVYVNDGVVTAVTYSLAKSVPADAVFTDTTALGSMSGTLGVDHGGTGATTKASARTNLGISSGTTAPSGGANGDIYFQYSA